MKRSIYFSVVLLLISLAASAQKLPNIQETSLRAPGTIKVDGKATEWNNQFQAYNKATEVFYTLSNDNERLYLTVQAIDLDIINKIICGGVTLTINGSGKMKDQGGVAITYPALDKTLFPGNRISPVHTSHGAPPVNLDRPDNWPADSFMVIINKDLISKAKDIRVEGVKEISNHLLSIYNQEGIKASALFDNKTAFTSELAIPLKYLGLSANMPKPFVYNIKLKGMETDLNDQRSVGDAIRSQREAMRAGFLMYPTPDVIIGGPETPRLKYLFTPADFWGEYTLAK